MSKDAIECGRCGKLSIFHTRDPFGNHLCWDGEVWEPIEPKPSVTLTELMPKMDDLIAKRDERDREAWSKLEQSRTLKSNQYSLAGMPMASTTDLNAQLAKERAELYDEHGRPKLGLLVENESIHDHELTPETIGHYYDTCATCDAFNSRAYFAVLGLLVGLITGWLLAYLLP